MSRDFADQVQAGLRALADVLPSGFDAERLELAVSLAGDGLRLEVELPRTVLRWLEHRTPEERRVVLDARREALAGQGLPPSDEPDERLELAVQARDEAESALVTTRRLERENTWDAPGFAELDEVCMAFDAHVQRFGREAVERALGPRGDMLGPGHWASRLPERGATEQSGMEQIPRGEGRPSDEAIRAFVQEGRHHRTVLRLAEADASFAAELQELVEALRESGEQVGLAARRWARDHEAAPSPLAAPIPFPTKVRRAAADATDQPTVLEDLGHLVVFDASAHLVIERGHVTLELEADEALSEVRFGGVLATEDQGLWSVRVPYASSLALLVRSPDGRLLEETLALEAMS